METNSNLPILTRVQDFEDVWEEPVQLNIGVMYSVQKYYHIFYIVVSTTVTKCFALAFQKGYIDPLIVRKQQCEFAHIKKNNMGIVVSSNSWTRFYI